MSGSKKLMTALDDAAAKLLAKHFPDNPPLTLDAELQIKAFAACVNWYGPRTKLGAKDEEEIDEFTRLRAKLHGRGKTRRNTSGAEDQTGTPADGNGAADAPE